MREILCSGGYYTSLPKSAFNTEYSHHGNLKKTVNSTNQGLTYCFADCHSRLKKVVEKVLIINIRTLHSQYMHTQKL